MTGSWNLAALKVLLLGFPMVICARAQEATERIYAPVVFRLVDKNIISVDIVNVKKSDMIFTSNIKSSVTHSFMGFPKRAAIQYRNANGEVIRVYGSRKDGWLWPDIFAADGDSLEKTREIDQVSQISIAPHGVVSFPFTFKNALRKYGDDRVPASEEKPIEFRVKLTLNILTAGKPTPVEIESPWFRYTMENNSE